MQDPDNVGAAGEPVAGAQPDGFESGHRTEGDPVGSVGAIAVEHEPEPVQLGEHVDRRSQIRSAMQLDHVERAQPAPSTEKDSHVLVHVDAVKVIMDVVEDLGHYPQDVVKLAAVLQHIFAPS